MMLAYKQNPQATSVGDKASVEAEVLRLWDAKWTAKKIGEYLGIKASKVGNIVHKHGKARKPRGTRTRYPEGTTVSLQDAPVEAWQQAVLPDLENEAEELGAPPHAYIVACLMLLKSFDSARQFQNWACDVTGYSVEEIDAFIDRAIANYMIVDGRLRDEDQIDPKTEYLEIDLVLLAGILAGKFERTADRRYFIAGQSTPHENQRWDDDGGHPVAA